MTPLPRLPVNPTLPSLSVTPQARPGLFKSAIAWLLILTLNVSAMGQAAAQIIRGPNGAPLTGYTANGTFVQNGQVVGNPHQQLHDLTNPTLWTTAAASFTNSTDPSFTQGTLAEIEAAIAVTPEPGGLALSRLYITVPPTVPLANPYTDPNAGAAGCNAATTCNQAVYNQLLLDAQASGYVPTVDPVSGLSTHIGKTHASSSPEIFDRGFNLYQTKPVFVAAENPAGEVRFKVGFAALWPSADTLIPASPAAACAGPSTGWTGRTACAAAPCSWPSPGSAPSRARTGA